MRVIELPQFGVEHLREAEREVPSPGPGQVLVEVAARSLNYRDLLMVQGQYNPRQPLPLVPLSDGAGTVSAVGAGVSRVAVGDRVCPIFAQRWLSGPPSHHRIRHSTLGGPLDGMLADYALFDEDGLVIVPAHLSLAEAATLPCAALTAWSALFDYWPLRPGETVLIQGTGGVSLFALQFAKLAGARALLLSGSDEKLARVRAAGIVADETVNYRTCPDWHKEARRLTAGEGVDRVIEVGGAGTFERSLAATRMGGFVATIGVLAGAKAPLSVLPVLMSSLTVQGIQVGSRDSFEAMNRALADAGLRPFIGATLPLAETRDAFAMMAAGKHVGKIVIADG